MVQSGSKPIHGPQKFIFDHPASPGRISELFSKVEISTSKSIFHASYSLTCLKMRFWANFKSYGPRHTPNPSTLRTFCHQNITNKKLLTFSEKFYEHFKIILQHLLKLFRTHYPLKKLSDFDLQDFENFLFWKKCTFYEFSKILEFDFPLDHPVLTKCWPTYSRSIRNLLLMFFIFWIMIISPKLTLSCWKISVKIFDIISMPSIGFRKN